MALFKIPNVGGAGIITDVAPQDLPPNVWTSASNIRFYNGKVQNVLHDLEVLDDDGSPSTKPDLSVNNAQAILGYFIGDDSIFYATGDAIYQYTSGGHVNVTNPGSPSSMVSSDKWISFPFSNCIVFSNPNITPQIMVPGDVVFSDCPDWDPLWTCENMVAYKNFLVALFTTENGTEYPQRVRWSDAALPNEAPQSWDASDPTKLAGFNDLTDARGEIMTAATLADVMFLYTTEEIFAMQYIGGSSIFNFRKVNGDVGVLNKDCVCPFKNGHVLMSRDNVYSFNGTQIASIVDQRIRSSLFTSINMQFKDKIKIFSNPLYNEVWICFPNKSSTGELNEAAVWNSELNIWSFRQLPNIVSISNVRKPVQGSYLWYTATFSWDSRGTEPWSTRDYDGNVLLASTSDGTFLLLDHTTANANGVVSTLERKYIDLDEAGAQSTSIKSIKSIYPQFGGNGTLLFKVGVSDYIGGPITWSQPKVYEIGTTNRIDFRASGRYLSLNITTADNSNEWFFTGYDIEFDQRFKGRRTTI